MAKQNKFTAQDLTNLGMVEVAPGQWEKKKSAAEIGAETHLKLEKYISGADPYNPDAKSKSLGHPYQGSLTKKLGRPDLEKAQEHIAEQRELGNNHIDKKLFPLLFTPLAVFNLTPVSKPRMTTGIAKLVHIDAVKLNKSGRTHKAAIERYWRFKNEINQQAIQQGFVMTDQPYHIIVRLPMAKSWNKTKKQELNGKPHQATPDADNILKAIQDSLMSQDKKIYDVRITKLWATEGSITFYSMEVAI